ALLAEGCRVAICARDKARLDAAARSLEQAGSQAGREGDSVLAKPGDAILAQPADVAKPGEAEAFIEATASHFGGLDILVHNAGSKPTRRASKHSPSPTCRSAASASLKKSPPSSRSSRQIRRAW